MSAVMAEKEQNEGIQLATPGLGERLRSARLACDMDVAKLAARIHLTTDVIDALECDDYSEMQRVFVRGYIRNYARTVDLPVDSVLAQFDRQWPDEDTRVEISPSPRLAPDTKPGNSWPQVVTWLVLLVILGLFLIWWQGYLDRFIDDWDGSKAASHSADLTVPPGEQGGAADRPSPSGAPTETLEQPSPEVAMSPMKGHGDENAQAYPAVVEEKIDTSEPATLPEPKSKPDMPVNVEDTASSAPAASRPVVAAEKKEVPAPVETAPDDASAPEQQPAEVAVPEIVVRFSQDCWVDIRDSTRTFKLVGTLPKGSERKLGGTPPYKVVLGNAAAAEIRIDGKPFDLTPYTVANVARFTLLP